MRIIHFSDTHEAGRPESWRGFLDKRLFGFLNCVLSRGRLHKQTLLERAVSKFIELKPDLIVCTGDLTTSGQPGEFSRALARLAPLASSGIPLLYLPGNHDSYVYDFSCRKALAKAFWNLNARRFRLSELPQAFDIGCCRLLAINCARPTMPMLSCGFMDKETSDFVVAECAAQKTQPFRLVVGHFPLAERHPWKRCRHKLYGHDSVVRLLRSGAIDLSLCGHVHKPYTALDANGRGEVCAGALTRFGGFSILDLDPATGKIGHQAASIL